MPDFEEDDLSAIWNVNCLVQPVTRSNPYLHPVLVEGTAWPGLAVYRLLTLSHTKPDTTGTNILSFITFTTDIVHVHSHPSSLLLSFSGGRHIQNI